MVNIKQKLIKNSLKIICLLLLLFNINNVFSKDNKDFTLQPELYETPTRFIIIVVNGDRGVTCTKNIGCADVYYYEINKKTGKSVKLEGETLNNHPSLSLQGYAFENKDYLYRINLNDMSIHIFKKINSKKYETIIEEPIISYD